MRISYLSPSPVKSLGILSREYFWDQQLAQRSGDGQDPHTEKFSGLVKMFYYSSRNETRGLVQNMSPRAGETAQH